MAYVFGFNKDITDIIYSFRDWKLEEVKRKGGTPSCLALKPYKIMKKVADPCTYFIRVELRNMDDDNLYLLGLLNGRFAKLPFYEWLNVFDDDHYEFINKHGPRIYPCISPGMHDMSDGEYEPSDVWRQVFMFDLE